MHVPFLPFSFSTRYNKTKQTLLPVLPVLMEDTELNKTAPKTNLQVSLCIPHPPPPPPPSPLLFFY